MERIPFLPFMAIWILGFMVGYGFRGIVGL